MSVAPEIPEDLFDYQLPLQEDGELERAIDGLRDQTQFPHDFETEDVSMRSFGENIIGLKLTKIGRSVLILGEWQDEDFVRGRYIIKQGNTLVYHADFDSQEADPELIRDIGLVSAAMDRISKQRKPTRLISQEILNRGQQPIHGNHGTVGQIVLERARSKSLPGYSDDDLRMQERLKRGPAIS